MSEFEPIFWLEKTKFPRCWKLIGRFYSRNLELSRLVTSPKRKPPLKEVIEYLKTIMIEESKWMKP